MARRNYDNDYPSVTQILGVLRKIGLEMWFKYNTAKFCDDKSNKGKLIGTQIHDGIESYINTGEAKVATEYEGEVITALNSFVKFKKDNPDIEFKLAELSLTSELYKFNGMIDCVGNDMILDWKTGECKDNDVPVIYDEWKYQVAAYVYLYNEHHAPMIKQAKIIAIAKDYVAYNVYTMDYDEIRGCFNRVFRPCLSIVNYQREQKQIARELKKEEKRRLKNAVQT